MNIIDNIVSIELYEKSTNKDYVDIKCCQCGSIYKTKRGGITEKIKSGKPNFCSQGCISEYFYDNKPIDKEELIRLFDLGYTYNLIADSLNEDYQRVRYFIKKLGLKRATKRINIPVDLQTVQVSGDYRYCRHCNTVKGLSDFYKCENGVISGRCKECDKAARKTWHQNNREYACKSASEKQKKQRPEINLRIKKRYHSDPDYKLKRRMSGSFSLIFKNQNITKNHSAFEIFDLFADDLKAYLTTLFEPGMDWDNYGKNGWEIDHIIPSSSYDFRDVEEMKKCQHHLNLKPRWASNKIAKKHFSNSMGNIEKSNYIFPELLTQFHLSNLMPKNGLIGFKLITGEVIKSKEHLESLVRAHLSSNMP